MGIKASDTRPKATFAMRSSPSFGPAMALMVVLGLAGVGAGLFLMRMRPPGAQGWLLVAMCFAIAFAPIAMWSSHRTYLVPGGRGELRLFADRIEVWSAGEGLVALPMGELRVGITEHVARLGMAGIPMADVNTDQHLALEAGDQKMILSQKLFAEPGAVAKVARAIEQLRSGGDLLDDAEAPPTPRDPWDDQLDRELAALDD